MYVKMEETLIAMKLSPGLKTQKYVYLMKIIFESLVTRSVINFACLFYQCCDFKKFE